MFKVFMKQNKEIICKVYKNKKTGQKLVTIPQKIRSIQPGDYIQIIKAKVLILWENVRFVKENLQY